MKKLSLIQRFALIAFVVMSIVGTTFVLVVFNILKTEMLHHAVHNIERLIQKHTSDHLNIEHLASLNSDLIKSDSTKHENLQQESHKPNSHDTGGHSHKNPPGDDHKSHSHDTGGDKDGNPSEEDIEGIIQHLMIGQEVHKLKIWNNDNSVVWSTDKRDIGNQGLDDHALKRALSGETVIEILDAEQVTEKYGSSSPFSTLLEVHIPVWSDSSDNVKAVFEVYKNFDPFKETLAKHKHSIWLLSFIAFNIVYIELFGIVWMASRRIDAQTKEISRGKQDWENTFNAITDAITVHDMDCNLVTANKAAQRLLNSNDPEEKKAVTCFQHYHDTGLEQQECPSRICLRTGTFTSLELYEKNLNKYIEIRSIPRKDENNNVEGLIHVVRDITERKKSDNVIETQLNRMNALRSIDRAIIGSLDLKIILDIFLEQVIDHLHIDAASVLLLNKHSHVLEYVTSKGFRSTALKYTKLRLGESNAGRAAIKKRIVAIPSLDACIDGFSGSKYFGQEDFVTYFGVPLIAKGQVMGVLELFHRTTVDASVDWMGFLEAIADQGAIAIDNVTMFDEIQQSNLELVLAYDSTIEGWSRALDMRDKETEGHTQRVAEMTLHVAREMGIKDENIVHFRRGALLHDMGKMGIPDSILLKPGKLTDEERKIIERHPVYAHQMLYPIEYLRPAIDIPYYHHEKWDGTGYPKGLKGEEIPLSARIFAIVDVWDALRSDRPYRAAWPKEKVVLHILSLSGTHFDPAVVTVFIRIVDAMEEAVISYSS